MKTWLVTGGAGFIGSNFLRVVYPSCHDRLVIIDKLTYAGNIINIQAVLSSPRVKFIKGDIRDRRLVEKIFYDYEISQVIHFAAESHVDRSIANSEIFIETNVEGTYNLLEIARKAWVEQENNMFLHVSTDEVYGALGNNDSPFKEDSPYRPNSPYAASKAASNHLVRAWNKTYNLPTIITNCSNNYGIYQFPEKLIPLMILNAIEEKDLPIYGDGLQIRDWLHVEDHCLALLSILKKGKFGESYNIGGNNERSNLEVVQKICDIVDQLKSKAKGTTQKLIRNIDDRPGHDRRYAIDSSKVRKETNWKPLHNFDESLFNVVLWYYKNKEWVNSIRLSKKNYRKELTED